MNGYTLLLLCLTLLLSGGRDVFSKNVSGFRIGTKKFFLCQGLSFGVGALILLVMSLSSLGSVAPLTVLYALIYGTMLVMAQWCYITAMNQGNIMICSTVYSLGFIFPTLSGTLFWDEKLNLLNVLGILLVIPAIILSGGKQQEGAKKVSNRYIFPLVLAMAASGGLGIMQKVQQNCPYADEKNIFILIAFVFAAAASFVGMLFAKGDGKPNEAKMILSAGGVGLCFAVCNVLNTTLAGLLDSAVMFPLINIGRILLATLSGIVIYRDKITKKNWIVLALGIAAILLINA